jgi:hypothetical protein
LAVLVFVFTSQPFVALESQSAYGALQVNPQLPDEQVVVAFCRDVHACPQAPQFVVLVFVLTSHPLAALPSQSAVPAGQDETLHAPALHTADPLVGVGQACPQVPQFATLARTSTSHPFVAWPSQSPYPLAQFWIVQEPAMQDAVAFTRLQRRPHAPQCADVVWVFVSQPLDTSPSQLPVPGEQTRTHRPLPSQAWSLRGQVPQELWHTGSAPHSRPVQSGVQVDATQCPAPSHALPVGHAQMPPHPSPPQVSVGQLGLQPTQCPDALQVCPPEQVPHVPPQPSSPHARTEQSGIQAAKVAETVRSAFITRLHAVPVEASQPAHPEIDPPFSGAALSSTLVPSASATEQVAPQSMPEPVTLPVPVPALVMVSVRGVDAAMHWPEESQACPPLQVPHEPSQPFGPQTRPAQSGVQEGVWSHPWSATPSATAMTRKTARPAKDSSVRVLSVLVVLMAASPCQLTTRRTSRLRAPCSAGRWRCAGGLACPQRRAARNGWRCGLQRMHAACGPPSGFAYGTGSGSAGVPTRKGTATMPRNMDR